MEFSFLGKLRAALVWSNFGILFKSYIIIRLSVKKSDSHYSDTSFITSLTPKESYIDTLIGLLIILHH